jgi:hypothetical protein
VDGGGEGLHFGEEETVQAGLAEIQYSAIYHVVGTDEMVFLYTWWNFFLCNIITSSWGNKNGRKRLQILGQSWALLQWS